MWTLFTHWKFFCVLEIELLDALCTQKLEEKHGLPFLEKTSNQNTEKRNLQKFMLGTSRNFNERSFMPYQLRFMLVQLAPLDFGTRFYPFTYQGFKASNILKCPEVGILFILLNWQLRIIDSNRRASIRSSMDNSFKTRYQVRIQQT